MDRFPLAMPPRVCVCILDISVFISCQVTSFLPRKWLRVQRVHCLNSQQPSGANQCSQVGAPVGKGGKRNAQALEQGVGTSQAGSTAPDSGLPVCTGWIECVVLNIWAENLSVHDT